jgi:hypothetical protein
MVAPLLTSFHFKYSTYRTKDDELYEDVYSRKRLGCFRAIELFDCYLVDLNASRIHENIDQSADLNNVSVDDDEEISFIARNKSKNVQETDNQWHGNFILLIISEIPMHICNRESFGYAVPINSNKNVEKAAFTFINTEHLLNGPNRTYNKPFPISNFIDEKFLNQQRLRLSVFDKIYVINLEKRKDRRDRIMTTLNLLNLEYELVKAVDGMKINEDLIKDLGGCYILSYMIKFTTKKRLFLTQIKWFLSNNNNQASSSYRTIWILITRDL